MFLISEDGWSVTGFKGLVFARQLRHGLHQAQAAVPAQQRVIISLRANLFRILKAAHGILKAGEQRVCSMPCAHLRLGSPFMEDALIIGTLISAGKLFKTALRLAEAIRKRPLELVSEC